MRPFGKDIESKDFAFSVLDASGDLKTKAAQKLVWRNGATGDIVKAIVSTDGLTGDKIQYDTALN